MNGITVTPTEALAAFLGLFVLVWLWRASARRANSSTPNLVRPQASAKARATASPSCVPVPRPACSGNRAPPCCSAIRARMAACVPACA